MDRLPLFSPWFCSQIIPTWPPRLHHMKFSLSSASFLLTLLRGSVKSSNFVVSFCASFSSFSSSISLSFLWFLGLPAFIKSIGIKREKLGEAIHRIVEKTKEVESLVRFGGQFLNSQHLCTELCINITRRKFDADRYWGWVKWRNRNWSSFFLAEKMNLWHRANTAKKKKRINVWAIFKCQNITHNSRGFGLLVGCLFLQKVAFHFKRNIYGTNYSLESVQSSVG